MDLLRFTGMGDNDKRKIMLFDRPSFHSGSYFFTVVHVTESRVIFEVWSTETPCDPEKFEEEVTNDDLMTFKLSVYCRRPIIDMNFTMKTSPTGDPYMLLDCEAVLSDFFKPTEGVQYKPIEPILDYITIGGTDVEDFAEYPIAVDALIPQIQDINIPITDHVFLITIRVGKIGTELDDRLLDYLYKTYVKPCAQKFQSMIGYDQSHYIQFAELTRASLDVDQITIDIAMAICGVDGLAMSNVDLNSITCAVDRQFFPISSKDYDCQPNLLLVAPYFYRKDNFLPYIQAVENIQSDEDQSWIRVFFKTKFLRYFDSIEDLKKSHLKNTSNISYYAKIHTMKVPDTSYILSIFMRKVGRVDGYRSKNNKVINPIGYVQVTMSEEEAMVNQRSSEILKITGPHLLEFLEITEPMEFQIIYREPTKLHLVF